MVARASGTCGLNKAGPTVQKVTRPISHPGGMFWSDANGEHKLAFVDRYNPAICRYTPSDGLFNRLPLRGKCSTSTAKRTHISTWLFGMRINRRIF